MSYAVIAKWTAKAGEEEAVAAAVRRLIEPSRGEPGNLIYQAHRDPDDPCVFLFYERYVDEAAFAAHGDSAHFATEALGDAIPRLETRERTGYVTWPDD